jgi:hypothetical protein
MENIKNSNIKNPLHVEAILNENFLRCSSLDVDPFFPLRAKFIPFGKNIEHLMFCNRVTDVTKRTVKTEQIL